MGAGTGGVTKVGSWLGFVAKSVPGCGVWPEAVTESAAVVAPGASSNFQ
jgi:hypothetical protein